MKYYWPIMSALVIYTILSFFWGKSGIGSIMEMESIQYQLENNIDELNYINRQLNEDLKSLGSDPERIAVQSRNLGYIRDREKILFMNINGLDYPGTDVGKILQLEQTLNPPEQTFKWISFLIFISGTFISFISDRKGKSLLNQ